MPFVTQSRKRLPLRGYQALRDARSDLMRKSNLQFRYGDLSHPDHDSSRDHQNCERGDKQAQSRKAGIRRKQYESAVSYILCPAPNILGIDDYSKERNQECEPKALHEGAKEHKD